MLRAARSTFLRNTALFAGINGVATAAGWTPSLKECTTATVGFCSVYTGTEWLAARNPDGKAAAALSGMYRLLGGFRPQLPARTHAVVVGAAYASVQLLSTYALDLPGLAIRLQRQRQRQQDQQQEGPHGQVQADAAPCGGSLCSSLKPHLQPVLPLMTDRTMMRLRPGDTDWWFDASLRYVGPGATYYPPDHPLTAQAEAVRDQVLADALEEIEDAEGPGSAAATRLRQRFGSPSNLPVRVFRCQDVAAVDSFAIPNGVAVREGAGMAAAVQHGVHSALREAGVYVWQGWYRPDSPKRGNWYCGTFMCAALWPWTFASVAWPWQFAGIFAVFVAFNLTDPESRRSWRAVHVMQRMRDQREQRAQQLRQEGQMVTLLELQQQRRERAERWARTAGLR